MHLWCIECNERPVTVTSFVSVVRGKRQYCWELEVCYPCWQVLETMMDAGRRQAGRAAAGRQLKLAAASPQ